MILPLISAPAAGSVVGAVVASPPVSSAVVAAGFSVAAAPLLVLLDPHPVRTKEKIMIITKDNENNLFLITLSPFRLLLAFS